MNRPRNLGEKSINILIALFFSVMMSDPHISLWGYHLNVPEISPGDPGD